jgi:hypothetical protein
MSVALPQPLFQNFEDAIDEAVQHCFNKAQYDRWFQARRGKGPPAAALATKAGAEAVDLRRGGKASHLKLHSPIFFIYLLRRDIILLRILQSLTFFF